MSLTQIPGLTLLHRGKVRDVYALPGNELLIVASDRLSAFDVILPDAIPGKGEILTQLSNFWFERLADLMPHHLLATDLGDFPDPLRRFGDLLADRAVLVRKVEVIPFECVARGYLAGSGCREYRASGAVCGIPLPPGLERASRLPEPIFTPATKAAAGHDENISFVTLADSLGEELAGKLRDLTLRLYQRGAEQAASSGLILADTKLEFGLDENGFSDYSRIADCFTFADNFRRFVYGGRRGFRGANQADFEH